MRRSMTMALALTTWTGCQDSSGGGGGVPVFGEPGQYAPCDVPRCGGGQFGLAVGDPAPSLHLTTLTAAEAGERVRLAFERGDEGARLLSHLLQTDRLPPATAARLVRGLDQVAPGWRAITAPTPEPEPAIATGEYALDTVGCGEMALRIELTGVTVVERDDNFVGDKVYCIVQARDDHEVEVLHTEVSPALQPGDRHRFRDGVMYGREGPKDPGDRLNLRYDCWEHDSTEDYEQFREVVRRLGELGKAVGNAHIIAASRAASILIELSAALDASDHLYTAEETMSRQALWSWINEVDRTVSAGGTNNGSDWSWKLHFQADGCAGGVQAAPQDPGAPACGPSTCDGCCVAGRCEGGTDDQTCGRGGGACESCDPGETCGQGQCRFNQGAQFSLTVLSGEVDATKPSGECWDDLFGACDDPPDPRLSAASGGRRGETTLARDTYYPNWNATVLQGVAARDLMSQVSFEITDDDTQFDDDIGRCSFAMEESDLRDGGPFEILCGSIRVRFEVRPQ